MRQLSKIWFLALSCTVVATVVVSHSFGRVSTWPEIRPLHANQTFINLAERSTDTPFLAFITSVSDVPLYKLECHNGNYDDESEMDFSGDFQCALFAIKDHALTSTNLLAANTKDELSTDWWNRGRMLSRQVRGECLANPEYSTDRHFKVRGMLVTMRFTDIGWSAQKDKQGNIMLARFTFNLDVVPDKTARGARAALPTGPKPESSCYP